ncbi:MAG: glycosyltransferase family 2 protein [bacterium]|nr:glycosyltransferase family 2 protein [bacterium]
MPGYPLVSINIPTYNAARTLAKCLDHVKNQVYPNIEIVIIDSDSTDETIEIARRYQTRILTAGDLAEARKVGVLESYGEYVYFLDADQYIEPNLIAECVKECEENGYDAVTFVERQVIHNNTYFQRLLDYDKWVFHTAEDDDPIAGDAIPRFFRRSILLEITWPENLYAIEHNIIYHQAVKKGAKVKFRKDLSFLHDDSINTYSKFIRNFYTHGKSYIPALKQDRELVLAHSLPRRSYFSKRAFSKPLYWPGLILLYLTKGIAAGCGVLSYILAGGKFKRGKV